MAILKFNDVTEIKDFLVEEAEYDREDVENMSAQTLVDSVLQWEGICGYTNRIINLIEKAFEVEIR